MFLESSSIVDMLSRQDAKTLLCDIHISFLWIQFSCQDFATTILVSTLNTSFELFLGVPQGVLLGAVFIIAEVQ